MSELRITPVQVPVSQARGVDEMGFAGQPSYPGQPDFTASMGFPGQPGAFSAPAAAPRSYSAPASGGALAAAYLIDMVCFAALTALAWWVYPSLPVVVIVACELWIIATFIRARSGRTPGAFAMQIAAISTQPTPTERGMEFDRAPGLGRQSAHSFIMLLLHVTVVGPVITWAIARDGQTWVDRVCGMGNLDIRASRSGASEAVFASRQTSASEAAPGSVAAPSPAHQWAGPSASRGSARLSCCAFARSDGSACDCTCPGCSAFCVYGCADTYVGSRSYRGAGGSTDCRSRAYGCSCFDGCSCCFGARSAAGSTGGARCSRAAWRGLGNAEGSPSANPAGKRTAAGRTEAVFRVGTDAGDHC